MKFNWKAEVVAGALPDKYWEIVIVAGLGKGTYRYRHRYPTA